MNSIKAKIDSTNNQKSLSVHSKNKLPIIVCFFLLFFRFIVVGIEQPKREYGIITSQALLPQYAGTNEYYGRSITLPYLYFRFDKIDFGSAPQYLKKLSKNSDLSTSLALRLPLFSDNLGTKAPKNIDDPNAKNVRTTNYLRRGMNDIPWLLGVGFKFSYYANDYLTFTLPLRHFFTVGEGFISKANTLSFATELNLLADLEKYFFGINYSLLYGDALHNNLYYGVNANETLEQRAIYQAQSGLVFSRSYIGAGLEISDFYFFFGQFIYDLNNSVIKDSPLVNTKKHDAFFASITWRLFSSKEKVQRKSRFN